MTQVITRVCVCLFVPQTGQNIAQVSSSFQADDYSSDSADRPNYTDRLMNNDQMSGLRLGYWFRYGLQQGIRQPGRNTLLGSAIWVHRVHFGPVQTMNLIY